MGLTDKERGQTMSELFSCLFILMIAFNSYQTAKRQGKWSWLEFFIVVAALIVVPILIVFALMAVPWLQDKPVWFTLIATGLIILSVVALALILRKFPPMAKSAP
jgi:hypothetical protein